MSMRWLTPVAALVACACSGFALVACGIGAIAVVFVLQNPSTSAVRTTSPGSDISEEPAEEFTAEEGAIDPAGWWTGDQADAACKTLESAFSDYYLTDSQGTTQLTCEYGSQTVEGGMNAARIEIHGFPTAEAARLDWLSEFGPDSDFARTWAELQGEGRTFAAETDGFFLSIREGHAGKTAYKTQGGLLYRNAMIVFDEAEAADATLKTWQAVQALARQLVDLKNTK